MESYFTIESTSNAEYKDRGSRFIAYANPCKTSAEFKNQLKDLKKEHPKAVHHCFAYRLGTDGNLFRSSDDGEPSGTAGKPILGQIDSKGLIDVSVIVVRYFGGTLLGVPGLIQAYKSVTALALQIIPIVQKPILKNYQLHFDYTRLNAVMHIIKQVQGEIIKIENQLFCDLKVGIPVTRESEFIYKLTEINNIEIINF